MWASSCKACTVRDTPHAPISYACVYSCHLYRLNVARTPVVEVEKNAGVRRDSHYIDLDEIPTDFSGRFITGKLQGGLREHAPAALETNEPLIGAAAEISRYKCKLYAGSHFKTEAHLDNIRLQRKTHDALLRTRP
jgi:hypothetical protein